MASEKYTDYIKSKEWRKKRKKKLRQVGYKCLASNQGGCKGSLHVHHLHYRNFGNEELSDLQVFCEAHHKEADKARKSTDGPLFSNWEAEYLPDETGALFTDEDMENIKHKSKDWF